MKKYIKKIKNSTLYKFIILSSADPKQTSLMFKGVLMGIVPMIMIILNSIDISFSSEKMELIVNSIVLGIFVFFSCISIIQILIGGFRKIYFTIIGENKAISND